LGCAARALKLKSTGLTVEAERTGRDLIRNCFFASLAHDSCVLIKLLLRLLQCRKRRIELLWSLICRGSG
jgi:hypothetical protein